MGFESEEEISLVREFSSQLPVDVISAILGMEGDGQFFLSMGHFDDHGVK